MFRASQFWVRLLGGAVMCTCKQDKNARNPIWSKQGSGLLHIVGTGYESDICQCACRLSKQTRNSLVLWVPENEAHTHTHTYGQFKLGTHLRIFVPILSLICSPDGPHSHVCGIDTIILLLQVESERREIGCPHGENVSENNSFIMNVCVDIRYGSLLNGM